MLPEFLQRFIDDSKKPSDEFLFNIIDIRYRIPHARLGYLPVSANTTRGVGDMKQSVCLGCDAEKLRSKTLSHPRALDQAGEVDKLDWKEGASIPKHVLSW